MKFANPGGRYTPEMRRAFDALSPEEQDEKIRRSHEEYDAYHRTKQATHDARIERAHTALAVALFCLFGVVWIGLGAYLHDHHEWFLLHPWWLGPYLLGGAALGYLVAWVFGEHEKVQRREWERWRPKS